MKTRKLIESVRKLAPEEYASSWDNCGIQIAGTVENITSAAVTIDPTPEAVSRCLEWGAQVIVTHHPLYFDAKAPDSEGAYLDVLRMVLGAGAWLYSAHTSLDNRLDGPARWLGRELGLTNTRPLEISARFAPVSVSFYAREPITPEIGNEWADRDGVFSVSQSETQEVSIVCERHAWPGLAELIESSMGDTTEFFVNNLEGPVKVAGAGEIGDLPREMDFAEFAGTLGGLVNREVFTVSGPTPDRISTVAYCPGSGSSLAESAQAKGADILVTGDVKYHQAVETGLTIIDVGHFSLEEEMTRLFAGEISEAVREHGVEVRFFPGEDPMGFLIRD